MGLFGRLFLPVAAVLAATGVWLAAQPKPETVVSLAPHIETPASPKPAPPADKTPPPGSADATPVPERPQQSLPPEPSARARFARAFDRTDPRPRIAVIVTGLGLAREATERAIDETSPEVTLAFSPYADAAARLAEEARARGHEILIAAPMAAADVRRRDVGPRALQVNLTEQAARERLAWMLERVPAHVGMIGDLGDRFSRDPVAMKPVFDVLASQGLLYVENRLEAGPPSPADAAFAAATSAVPTASVTLWLDDGPEGASIDAKFAAAEAAARAGSPVIVLAAPAHARRLAAWMKTFESKGIAAAPISAVVRSGS